MSSKEIIMEFDDLYERARPKTLISVCGGISGNEAAPHMKEVYIHIKGIARIWLSPDGTYKLDHPGKLERSHEI